MPSEGEVASPTKPLKVRDRCQVRWRGGNQYLPAVIVERRPHSDAANGSKRKRRTGDIGVDIDSLRADAVDYYVHYVDHDRRLDEWVTLDTFQLDTLQRQENGRSDEAAASNTDAEHSDGGTRLSRRRGSSSCVLGGDKPERSTVEAEQPFSFTGGNWHAGSSNDPASAAFEREHEETTKVKNIEQIVMGNWEVAAWYYSPFPAEYSDVATLYVCEFCLTYMKKRNSLRKHKAECTCRHPPGREIYREDDISVYELDGKENRVYCQKLCLLAKLFLDHKTLYYDVTPFYFYVVTKVDSNGAHIVGYFSKEKVSNEGYNLACILTFPQYQQAGYGKFIISLSYELTKREGKTGSPEKPLSDLGKVSYRSYWTHVLMNLLANCDSDTDITMNDMSQQTGIKTEDIISTLQSLDMIKVWKGQHVVYVQQAIIENYMALNKKLRLCKSEFLNWEPPSGRPSKDTA